MPTINLIQSNLEKVQSILITTIVAKVVPYQPLGRQAIATQYLPIWPSIQVFKSATSYSSRIPNFSSSISLAATVSIGRAQIQPIQKVSHRGQAIEISWHGFTRRIVYRQEYHKNLINDKRLTRYILRYKRRALLQGRQQLPRHQWERLARAE